MICFIYFCHMTDSIIEHESIKTVFEEFPDDFVVDSSKLPPIDVEASFETLIQPLFDQAENDE